jgi:hypothetical protein
MQGLDAAVEHLRKSGVVGHFDHAPRRPAPAVLAVPPVDSNLDAARGQRARELDDAVLVRDAEQRPFHLMGHNMPWS